MLKDRNGNDYLIGSMGMATIFIKPHKTNAGEWNFMILENNRQQNGPPGAPQSGGGYAGSNSGGFGPPPSNNDNDEIPF